MPEQAPILLVEDEESDVVLLRHAFRKAGTPHPVVVAYDGKEAIDYLSGTSPDLNGAQRPLPALLLLDLTMPCMTGFDVLAWLRRHPELNQMRAVVLTSSVNQADQQRALELGAADYRVKPTDLQGLVQIAQDLASKWLA